MPEIKLAEDSQNKSRSERVGCSARSRSNQTSQKQLANDGSDRGSTFNQVTEMKQIEADRPQKSVLIGSRILHSHTYLPGVRRNED